MKIGPLIWIFSGFEIKRLYIIKKTTPEILPPQKRPIKKYLI